jgi:aconitate hydratase 2/2-methylisocitrate dehydratase
MSKYQDYLKEISERVLQGLHPLPINGAELVSDLVAQIKEDNHEYRKDSLQFFIYNILPGTTAAAAVKAAFLKEIILGKSVVKEISREFAFEQLSHMKGGPSIEVLLDLVFENNETIARQAAKVLKTQVFLYEADMERLGEAYEKGNEIVKDILESYAQAEFFYKITRH